MLLKLVKPEIKNTVVFLMPLPYATDALTPHGHGEVLLRHATHLGQELLRQDRDTTCKPG